MKFIGAHVSIAGGVENAPINAAKINSRAFALFTHNQRQWKSKPYTNENIKKFNYYCRSFGFDKKYILPHASYLLNLCSPEPEILKKSREAFKEELNRVNRLGLKYLNVHPGAHKNRISLVECLKLMSDSINEAIEKVGNVTVVLENTAGEGSVVGYDFEHLAGIIDLIKNKERIGVCLDTCHLFAAGYDIKTKSGFNDVFREFDSVVGFKYLKAMHLNDSKKGLGSKIDRHENIGKGQIGIQAFKFLMEDERFDNVPLILETPDSKIWPKEIKVLYSFT